MEMVENIALVSERDLISDLNLIIRKTYADVFYNAQLLTIAIKWKDQPFSDQDYMNLFDECVAFMRFNLAKFFYTDIRNQRKVSELARKYFIDIITPQTVELGAVKTAVISDDTNFRKFYINMLMVLTGRPAKICSSSQQAFDYLYSDFQLNTSIDPELKVSVPTFLSSENQIISETFVKVYYSKQLKLIGLEWNGVFTSEEYKSIFSKVLDFSREHICKGLYTDVTHQGQVADDAKEYFAKVVVPKGIELGFRKVAVVASHSVFKRYYFNTILKLSGKKAKLFEDGEEALLYLLMDGDNN